ncbi:hypothetical protein BH10ACT1_BH10ACT1_07130 [soil metagenome]
MTTTSADGPIATAEAGELVAVDTPLSPRVVLLWRVPYAIATLVLLVPALLIAVAATEVPSGIRVLLPLVVAGVGLACVVLLPPATYRRWRYAVTEDGVELRHGVLLRHESSIPHFRVQHIDVQQGPLDRWRGIVKLSISTASPATDATLPGIEPDRADELRARILARAEADDGV